MRYRQYRDIRFAINPVAEFVPTARRCGEDTSKIKLAVQELGVNLERVLNNEPRNAKVKKMLKLLNEAWIALQTASSKCGEASRV